MKLPYTEQSQWLFLIQSENFKGYWEVQGLDSSFFFDFEELIGSFRLVSPAIIDQFLAQAQELDYQVAFFDDPDEILDAYKYLNTIPNIHINSSIEGNINGFLPWQIRGYNKLIKDESIKAGLFVWDTGSGKTCAITSAILHHIYESGTKFDVALCVVKSHNKIETQRKLKQFGNIDSIIIDGSKQQRQQMYQDVYLLRGEPLTLILNYEKIREDYEDMIPIIEGANCLFFWDEAPTKLSNRSTKLYKATRKFLYQTFPKKPRAKWMRHWSLSATPVENSPEDVYNVANIMLPGVLGSVRDFHNDHVASINFFNGKPDTWKNLEAFEAKLQFMMHRVSKDDPEVKKMFPTIIPKDTIIDWNPKHLNLYNKLTDKAESLLSEDVNILALIQIMQMMCDAPSMIKKSASNRQIFYNALENIDNLDILPMTQGSDIALQLIEQLGPDQFTNIGHTKLDTWKDIIVNKHPNDKIVTHSTWAEYIFPIWEEILIQEGISYVVYRGTQREKQFALDSFRNDPTIRCFLSGDAGSDSIDISEAAVGINYNIPWKYTVLKQREGRRDRVNSFFDYIYTYTLIMPFSVDERKLQVCENKYGYHAQLFDGKAQEETISSKITKEELIYMLLGKNL